MLHLRSSPPVCGARSRRRRGWCGALGTLVVVGVEVGVVLVVAAAAVVVVEVAAAASSSSSSTGTTIVL